MATAPYAGEILDTSPEKENYQRISRLLICGGTELLRSILDSIYPPSLLPIKLQETGVKRILRAKATKQEFECLYPPSRRCVKTTDLDITLLSKLLRNVCNLPSPTTGWNDFPPNADHSLTADLVRIRLYRNNICHKYPYMEMSNGDFLLLWNNIKMTLLRIASKSSSASSHDWENAIDKLLSDPLTPEAIRNVEELQQWYLNDKDVKEGINSLESKVDDLREMVLELVQRFTPLPEDPGGFSMDVSGRKMDLAQPQRQFEIAQRPFQCLDLPRKCRRHLLPKGIPLCLPNNMTWDPATGKTRTTSEERSSLYVVPTAIELLQKIKEPVCVVSIAGPFRDGKSYIIEKVFGQMDVFSIGREMDPETMGIWMCIMPQTFKDSHGRDFRVILLDSEGIGSVTAEGPIFTLNVLLASVLIYNSKGVPKRNDLNNLNFIAKLSQRIRIRSKGRRNDQDLFRNTFPFFIWLLRDVAQKIPEDCRDLNHYFATRVFKESQNVSGDEEKHQMVSESILNFFSGFEAFSLPAPSDDDEIMQDIENCWGKLNPKFRAGVESFETLLKSKLSPKQSVNRGEYITGEALGRLVQLYTDAINDPDAIPNVEAAWDTFVRTKCSEAKEGALKIYDSVMSVEMKGALPCDGKVILNSHKKANNQSLDAFEADTAELLSSNIDHELKELTISIDKKLNIWKEKNASETKIFCQGLLEALKMAYFDPVLAQIRSQGGASVTYPNIMAAWDAIKNDFHEKAVGSKDVIAVIFKEFNKDLRDEVKKYEDILKTMKDYDDNLAKEKVALATQEEEKRKLEECIANLNKREEALQRKIAIVENKREKEVEAMRHQAKTERERLEKNMNMMREAGMKRQSQFQRKLDAAADRERQANEDLKDLRRAFNKERENTKAQKLAVDRQNQRLEREAREMQAQLQNQLSAYDERERRNNDIMQNLSRQLENDRRELSSMRNELESVQSKLREANKPGFFRRILKAIW